MAERAIYDRLRTEVTAVAGRVYPIELPQDVRYPAVTYERTNAERISTFGGDSALVSAEFTVEVFAHKAGGNMALDTVGNAVRRALQRYSDESSTPPIYDIFIESEEDDQTPDTELYVREFDLRVWYRES